MIYPFGLNQSQKLAVERALSSKISIIQGPPGTGKTQTILNIIANVVRSGKTVAVVSNNNSATRNVVEKLEKKNSAFLTAFLGSLANKEGFLDAQTGAEFFAKQTYSAVAEADGKVLGLYILHPNNEGRCGHICNTSYAVKDGVRGRHIGEQLVRHSMAPVSYTHLTLPTN